MGLWCALGLLAFVPLRASDAVVFEAREFTTAVEEQRYRSLIAELRCLVCQNQNLADSNAELAADLRNEVYKMIISGDSDQQIVDFMVARYGDFVLYRPPVRLTTLALWGGPLMLVVCALWMLARAFRRGKLSHRDGLSESERRRLEQLIARHTESL